MAMLYKILDMFYIWGQVVQDPNPDFRHLGFVIGAIFDFGN